MKNALTFVLVVGIISIGWWLKFSRQDNAIRNLPLKGNKVVAFGDELTAGKGARPGGSYPDLLGERLGVSVINRGKENDTSLSAFARLEEVLALKPDLVVMTVGYQDLKQNVPLGETYAHLEKIFTRLLDEGVVVVYGGISPPQIGDNWLMTIEQLCKSMGVIYVDRVMAEIWQHDEFLSREGYPNEHGYKKITDKFWEEVKALWKHPPSK